MFFRGVAVAIACNALVPSAFAEETKSTSFKVFEEFSINTVNRQTVLLGKGQISPRPKPRPTENWRQVGARFGMKEDPEFCTADDLNTLLKRTDNGFFLTNLILNLDSEHRSQLSREETSRLASIPLCEKDKGTLEILGRMAPPEDDSTAELPPPSPDSNMIVNAIYSDEGHGWLVINARLSGGQQAIVHTGNKMNTGFLGKEEVLVTSAITKQPFALRKKLLDFRSETDPNGGTEWKTCYETVYRNHCVFNPYTNSHECKEIPYTVEGRKRVRNGTEYTTRVNELEFLSADQSRVLGSLILETKDSYPTSSDEGECETAPIADNGPHFPVPHEPR